MEIKPTKNNFYLRPPQDRIVKLIANLNVEKFFGSHIIWPSFIRKKLLETTCFNSFLASLPLSSYLLLSRFRSSESGENVYGTYV